MLKQKQKINANIKSEKKPLIVTNGPKLNNFKKMIFCNKNYQIALLY